MIARKSFVITRVDWHTKRPGNPDPPERYYSMHWHLTDFLQRHGLTKRVLASSLTDITDDSQIHTDDLTDEGFEFMRSGYQKWLRALDRGKDPTDTRILEKELAKLRGQG